MMLTRDLRRKGVTQVLRGRSVDTGDVDLLRRALALLMAIPRSDRGFVLNLDENNTITLDLEYETVELEKDIVFISQGEEAFDAYLAERHPTFADQVRRGLAMLASVRLLNLISDRDGTLNNYCGRYLSSIQSLYNAVFISRFAQRCVKNAVILTSAPLENGGVSGLCTFPPKAVILAGSKGREYRDRELRRGTYAIDSSHQKKLEELKHRVQRLLQEPRNRKFGLIGSAFQQKFAEITVARQDVTRSIPEQESNAFLASVKELVTEIDPKNRFFRVQDTGLDIEITLVIAEEASAIESTEFTKGHGVAFLNQQLALELEKGPNLVCGDTDADVPMLTECLRHSHKTYAIFVTREHELKQRVQALTSNALIIDEPDTLVSILNRLANYNIGSG
jgi:hypothetical protein